MVGIYLVREEGNQHKQKQTKADSFDLLVKDYTIHAIAAKSEFSAGPVDGRYCFKFRARAPICWDREPKIWKRGTASQIVENRKVPTGKEVFMLCEKGSLYLHTVATHELVPDGVLSIALPWDEESDAHEALIRKFALRSIKGLLMTFENYDIVECPDHGEAFKRGRSLFTTSCSK